MLERVLVANRGEIAMRVIRACFDEGVTSVLATSEADADSLPARAADVVVGIGPANASASYLNVGAVISAALLTGCDAIHPGYGFLSERPELVELCDRYGITFVGPSASAIRRGGDKIAARELARSLGIPVGAGSGSVSTVAEAEVVATEVGYPVLLKAAAGGGGRGMRRVDSPAELADAVQAAGSEAEAAFGDGRLYVEHYVAHARHVEVQVLADRFGTTVHLGDRDCSFQRRYQKLVEEAPASAVPAELRRRIGEAAVALMSALDYVGAGTVEFLVDVEQNIFSFLEVNTRVQVEHPVTEMVTGIDIVREQLRIAAGEPLSFTQDDVHITGHAFEFRINAESPTRGFAPSPGTLQVWNPPAGAGVRVDSHCFPGYRIPPNYDSLLAKLICRGATRDDALALAARALDAFDVAGIETTLPLHRALVRHPEVRGHRVTTRWIEDAFLDTWTREHAREDRAGKVMTG
ncbi:acetyl-CoA carboxylase biotin carboxylase subunit [Pseudonocardia acidicola]|uniref:biotin carboxylase n=1 Tax=Pseudonocardia acidicola TaxID=2724939 RepID=A0ABX1SAM6_9PSEU|nr:acetyl-CoA carboxylase biotin carboxylase subunit [Pseudonocardia acidicola]